MIRDVLLLQRLGAVLDLRPRLLSGRDVDGNCEDLKAEELTVQDLLIRGLLKVRSKDKRLVCLKANRAQREFSRTCTRRNIVLKARQVGITTYVAARFFIQTITQPGTVTVQVAHSQDSAEEIFQIVHRFWENLPEGMQKGALVRSRANIRQIVFPRLDSEYRVATAGDANAGRGMTIHNLHCSEVSRWPRDGEESLASLRAAVPEDGNIVIESTPNGAGGVFYEEWQRADETGYARHFLPWWFEGAYRNEVVGEFCDSNQKAWSQHAAEIAVQARGVYRAINGTLIFSSIGAVGYTLNESDSNFSPEGLSLRSVNTVINDITIIGDMEPQAYVSDYFVGDGLSTKFYLSQSPFTKTSQTIVDEEYLGSTLDSTLWTATDPAHAVSVSGGKLQIAGGTGVDGATFVEYVEKIELGGSMVLQHGDVLFNSASSGIIGGLYSGAVSTANCVAGFRISPSGTGTNIQALVGGNLVGTALNTITGHHYVLTTRIYSPEIYRRQQIFHSSVHPAGSGIGGAEVSANVRLVLEVHDIDPANPASQIAPSIVFYDAVISSALDFCSYAVVNAFNLNCSIAFTRIIRAVDTEVRSALPGQSYVTRLVGALSDGAECNTSSTELTFFTAYVPATNQLLEVHYRGLGRALTRVTNPASVSALQRGIDNGVRGTVRHVKQPRARTAADCENAALALLDDVAQNAWAGEYQTWSDFLPGAAQDIFPGDTLQINTPSRGAAFQAAVREVEIVLKDLLNDHSEYTIKFAQDGVTSMSFEFEAATIATTLDLNPVINSQVGTIFLPSLTSAQVTFVSSTTISVDAGIAPPVGGGIEVRFSDSGFGPDNDRNLVGRFSTRTMTLPRLGKVQTYFLKLYDNSVPPKYSRYSASLHVDYPL